MKRRLLILALIAGVAMALLLVLYAAIHSRAVQSRLWQRVTLEIRERSGVRVEAERVALRLLPARLEMDGLEAASDQGVFARALHVEARWSWRALLASPPRVELLRVRGPQLDLRRLPAFPETSSEQETSPAELLRLAEVDRLELESGDASGELPELAWQVDELDCDASWREGSVRAAVHAARIVLTRDGRSLDVGPLELAARADQTGVEVDRLKLTGGGVDVDSSELRYTWGDSELLARLRLVAMPQRLADFWDPELAAQLAMEGRLELGVEVFGPVDDLRVTAAHAGERLLVAGWEIDELSAEAGMDGVQVALAAAVWGRADVSLTYGELLAATVDLAAAPVGRLGAFVPGELGVHLPPELAASGHLTTEIPLPLAVDSAKAAADLDVRWPTGGLELRVRAAAGDVLVDRAKLTVPGGSAEIVGQVAGDASLGLQATAQLDDLPAVAAELARWWSGTPAVDVGGGPLSLTARISGTRSRPTVDAELLWSSPELLDRGAESLRVEAHGSSDALQWRAELTPSAGSVISVDGRTDPATTATAGRWSVSLDDLAELGRRVPELAELELEGAAEGEGAFAWDGATWGAEGRVYSAGFGAPQWWVDELQVAFQVAPDRVEISELTASCFGARVVGSGVAPLLDPQRPLQLELLVDGLDPLRLPFEAPAAVAGETVVSVRVEGSLAAPVVDVELGWQGRDPGGPVIALSLFVHAEDGQLRFVLPELRTIAGPVTASGSASLSELPLPGWMWPGSELAPLRVELSGQQLQLMPLLEAVGVADASRARLTADLDASVRWDLQNAERRWAELRLDNLVLESELETLAASAPLVVRVAGTRVEVKEFDLTGAKSHIGLSGSYDIESHVLAGQADLVLDPAVTRLIPLPVQVQIMGPITLQAEVGGTLEAPVGTLRLSHRDGAIVMRDPALEIRELNVVADMQGGRLTVRQGSAAVNRGTVLLGGGWDPDSGQGLVLELEHVAFLLPYGILSRWGGSLAVEPHPRQLVRVVGDLELEGGLWDRPFDYAGAFFGPSLSVSAADDPLRDVGLDIEVRGRGGIAVDNNLGRFKVAWDLLHVGGTAAEPALQGQLRIDSGGVLSLAGRAVEVRRGLVEFSGEPGAAPRVEIVPVEDVVSYGDESKGEFDATLLATKTLARGLGSALGFENDTLQPAEIAIETETDASSRFAVGQRLSRNLALFLTTNLSDVQDVQTLLQLWNLPYLKGLAVQAFQETADDVTGAAVIERVRWGGSSVVDDSPRIHRVRMVGEWPISKRRLKRAAGVAKGRPYDPFMLFAAGLRMEQELASEGYYEPIVEVGTEGDERLPTLVFSCQAGPRRLIVFGGDKPPKAVRRQLSAMYQPPPLEEPAKQAMRDVLLRYWAGEAYPDAEVDLTRDGEHLLVESRRGARRELIGPEVDGVPAACRDRLRILLANAADLDAILDRPELGRELVTRVMKEHGFQDPSDIRIWAESVRDDATMVHISAVPGAPDRIASIGLAGRDPLGVVDGDDLGIAEGDRLDRRAVDRMVFQIRRRYRNAGYPEVRVDTWFEEVEANEWTLWIELDPGDLRTVEAIEFTGLKHIRESVLRRGLVTGEGELLRVSDIDESAAKMASFAPVERIDVSTRRSSPDASTVEIAVTEKPRWTAGLGARYRSDRGLEALIDLRDDNLLGLGLSLNLRARWESDEQRVSILTALPRRPGGRWSTTAVFSYFEGPAKEDPLYSTEETLSASLEVSYQLRRSTTLRSYYRYDDTTISDPWDPYGDQLLKVGTLGALFIHDRLDDPFDPRSGYYAAADVGWSSSVWGSDLETVRSLLTGSLAVAPRDGWTWAQTLRLGVAEALKGTELDISQKFFAGGQASIRGFERDTVGPLQPSGGGFTGAGGGALFVLNEELRIPVWNGLRLAVFADAGQVWEDWASANARLSVGTGIGLRYSTPVGPLWADIAWPVANRGISKGYKIYFGIGRPF